MSSLVGLWGDGLSLAELQAGQSLPGALRSGARALLKADGGTWVGGERAAWRAPGGRGCVDGARAQPPPPV